MDKMLSKYSPILALSLAASTLAVSVPTNVRTFYNNHKSNACATSNRLSGAFKTGLSGGTSDVYYCKDPTSGVVYIKGSGTNYADMDIDCDGANSDQGLCSNDGSGQSQTAFKDTVKTFGISDLDAHIHSYVVFGNSDASPSWNPQSAGIEPLSVMAVVCGDKLIFGIWGDTNGGVVTGEAALSTGQLCFGDNAVSGDNGHEGRDVLYIAFPGKDAKLGASDANWKATSKEAFQQSIVTKGMQLVSKL